MIKDLQNQSRCFDKFLKLVIASGPMLLAAIFVLNVPPALAKPMQSSQAPAVKPVAKKPAAAPPKSPTSTTTATPPQAAKPSLEETRLTLSKWIETQQIISKERNDWQQGKEILQSRIELVGKEVGVLNEKIAQSQAAVVESNTKRDQLIAENDLLKSSTSQLANAVTVMEEQVKKLSKLMPEPVAARLLPLLQRIPVDPANTRVSTAERFQNVLGILTELNKVNSELAVTYEIKTLADGSSSEVQVLYIGLAQAYYISPRGEGGIGRPTEDGWKWEPAPATSNSILKALEIIQGKETPTFVPLPMKIQ
ncbi:MAG: DUF3450 family protein [Planctomycetes bacterium]|nr:DUF3450 family protein [Planctomycetota bacterium]